jgi:hypothetical protein
MRGKDRLSTERRSWNMSRIRGKDTTPEKIVRGLARRIPTSVGPASRAICSRQTRSLWINKGSNLLMFKPLIWIALAGFLSSPARAVISVTATGTGTNDFSTYEQTTNGWTTRPLTSGFASNITNSATLDAHVQSLSADLVSRKITQTATLPPDPGQFADWHSQLKCLVVSPTGNDFTPLMALLRNDSGVELSDLAVSYFATDGATNGAEDVPRLRAYYSLSGATGDWQVIPEFCNATGRLSATLHLGRWPDGALLFLLWADDNGPFANGITNRESVNMLDDFAATPVFRLTATPLSPNSIRLTWPASDASFVLQTRTNLNTALWEPAATPAVLSNGLYRVDLESVSGTRFFRLERQ